MKTSSVKTGEPVYILQNFLGSALAVYSTFHALSDGVDYWVDIMKKYSDENRTYNAWANDCAIVESDS